MNPTIPITNALKRVLRYHIRFSESPATSSPDLVSVVDDILATMSKLDGPDQTMGWGYYIPFPSFQ